MIIQPKHLKTIIPPTRSQPDLRQPYLHYLPALKLIIADRRTKFQLLPNQIIKQPVRSALPRKPQNAPSSHPLSPNTRTKLKKKISPFTHSLFVIGSFTSPPWQQMIPISVRHPSISLMLPQGALFKYVLKDEITGSSLYFCSENYPIVSNSAEIQNNIYRERGISVERFGIWDVEEMREQVAHIEDDLSSECSSVTLTQVLSCHSVEKSPRNQKYLIFKAGGFMMGKRGHRGTKLNHHESEDAYTMTTKGLAMSDGVSNWNKFGINAGKFSNELMRHCGDLFEHSLGFQSLSRQKKFSASYSNVVDLLSKERAELYSEKMRDLAPNPVVILDKAFDLTKAPGSATAVVVILNDGHLNGANLGDSGFMVFRLKREQTGKCKYYLVMKSEEQQHDFNKPCQLTRLPNEADFKKLEKKAMFAQAQILKKKCAMSQDMKHDRPCDADTYKLRIQEGDLVLVMTDGISDNLFNHEIQKIVNEHISEMEMQNQQSASALAERLVNAAKAKCTQGRGETRSPFGNKYKKAYKTRWPYGGKEDDLSVVAGFIGYDLY